MEGGNNNIRVVVRVKPAGATATATPWSCTDHTITHMLQASVPGHTFPFDRVYDQPVGQTRIIFEQMCEDVIEGAVRDGISGTVFAYGQTSAGKTFTMQGPPDNPGIIPLGLQHFFEHVLKERREGGRTVTVRMSYLEVYNEVVGDLLQKDNQNLKIHETVEKGVFVGNLSEPEVNTVQEAMDLVRKGEEVRKIGKTNMNDYSSRSHTLLRLHIESRMANPPPGVISGTRTSLLCFVDLAGSERSGQMGNEGQRLREGGHINKSLLSLTTVISKLAEFSGGTTADAALMNHIPYRDSKLTRILQPALSGTARCVIICAVSPLPQFVDETLSTLKFASRAKAIKSRALLTPNETVTDDDIIRCYREQVECLRGELGQQRKRAASFEDGLVAVKRARRDERLFLADYLNGLHENVRRFKETVWETIFIFEHISKDSSAIIASCQSAVQQNVRENCENMEFLSREKAAVETSLTAEIEGLRERLAVSQQSLSDSVALHEKTVASLQATIEELRNAKCAVCQQYRQEINDLNECVKRLEEQVKNMPCQPTVPADQLDAITRQLEDTKGLLREKECELEMRQSDLTELLNKLMQSKSEYSSMREQLTARIDELNEEAEHWRSLGKEADDKLDGLRVSLDVAREQLQHQESIRTENEAKLAEYEKTINTKQETIDALSDNINKLSQEKGMLEEELRVAAEQLSSLAKNNDAQLGQLTVKVEESEQQMIKLQEQLAESAGKLQESGIREQVMIESHRREVAVILEKLEDTERQRTDLSINYAALRASADQRESELQQTLLQLQSKHDALTSELVNLKTLQKESEEKLQEQLMINSVIKGQLEEEYRQKLSNLQSILERREEELAQARRTADESASMVELLRSSLKSRQEQHEQSIEDLHRVKSELARLRDAATVMDYDQMDRDLSAYKERVRELESLLSAAKQQPQPQPPADTSKQEMRLRVELERVKETAAKDRKLSQLRIADLEEQIMELTAAKTQQQAANEALLREAERERDSETAKVRQLQDAINQLRRDQAANEKPGKKEHTEANHKVVVKENKEPNNPKNNSTSSNPTTATNGNGKQNECLQQ